MPRLIAFLIGIVALGVALVVAIPLMVSSDWIRDRIVAQIEGATGLVFSLDDASLSIFPSIALQVDGVVASVPGKTPFAKAQSLRFGLALGPLLDGRAEITGISLIGPQLDLSVDAAGVPNWMPEQTGAPSAAGSPGGSPTVPIAIADLRVLDGRLTWTDLRSGTAESITDISLNTAFAPNAPLKATGHLAARGVAPDFTVEIATPLALLASGSSAVDLTLTEGKSSLAAQGDLAAAPLAFAGHVEAKGEDLEDLASRLSITLPAVLGNAAIAADVHYGGNRIEATNASLSAGTIAAKGEAALDLSSARPRVDLRARVDTLDLAALSDNSGSGEAQGSSAKAGGTPVDLAPLAGFDGGFDLAVNHLKLPAAKGVALTGLHLIAVVADGGLQVAVDKLALAGGATSGQLTLAPAGKALRFAGKIKASSLDVATLAATAGVATPIRGQLGADLDLTARGRTVAELIAGLGVAGTLSLDDGEADGLGLATVFADPAADRLRNIHAEATVTSLDAPVDISGAADFRKERLNFSLNLSPQQIIDGTRAAVSARLSGKRLQLSFDGDLSLGDSALSGQFGLKSPSASAFAAFLNRGTDGLPADPLSLAATIDATPDHVRLSDATFAFGGNEIDGLIELTPGDRPKLVARLSGKRIDLGALMGAGASGGSTPAKAAAPGWSATPLDFTALNAIDVDATFDAGSLAFGGIATDRAKAILKLTQGNLALDLPAFAAYGGTGTAKVTLDASGKVPTIAARAALQSMQMQPLLLATLGTGRIDGQAKISFDVNSAGASMAALMSGLAGTAAIDVANGRFNGVDLPALLRNIAVAVVTGFGQSPDAITPFDRLGASFAIDKGVATTKDLAFKSAVLSAKGSGRIDIGRKALNLSLAPKLTLPNGKKTSDFEVPIHIDGSWAAPRIYPEIDGILDNPQAAFDKLQSMGGLLASMGKLPKGANLDTALNAIAPGLGALATSQPQGGGNDAIANVVGTLAGGNGGGDALGGLVNQLGGSGNQAGSAQTIAGVVGALTGGDSSQAAGAGAVDALVSGLTAPSGKAGDRNSDGSIPLPPPRPAALTRANSADQPSAAPTPEPDNTVTPQPSADKPVKPPKADKPVKAEKPPKAEKPAKSDKPVKPEKPAAPKPDKPKAGKPTTPKPDAGKAGIKSTPLPIPCVVDAQGACVAPQDPSAPAQ